MILRPFSNTGAVSYKFSGRSKFLGMYVFSYKKWTLSVPHTSKYEIILFQFFFLALIVTYDRFSGDNIFTCIRDRTNSNLRYGSVIVINRSSRISYENQDLYKFFEGAKEYSLH